MDIKRSIRLNLSLERPDAAFDYLLFGNLNKDFTLWYDEVKDIKGDKLKTDEHDRLNNSSTRNQY